MKEKSPLCVNHFFKTNYNGGPILLAYSGGVDSSVLLDLILKTTEIPRHLLHICHIDHGWRTTSAQEAEQLQHQATKLGMPFHLFTLDASDCQLKTNLEDRARQSRKEILHSLYRSLGCEALIFAHQADDQAETVLKRIFEGASLPHCRAMATVEHYEGVTIWRPLLGIRKSLLVEYAQLHSIPYIEDSTNLDPHFLRNRMRQTLVPNLEKQFGKSIAGNLLQIGHYTRQLHAYFEKKIAHLESHACEGPFGIYWESEVLAALDPLEMDFFLRKLYAQEQEPAPSKTLVYNVTQSLRQRIAGARYPLKKGFEMIADRGRLFWLRQKIPVWNGQMWRISEEKSAPSTPPNWRHLWQGKVQFAASHSIEAWRQYCPSLKMSPNTKIDDWLCSHKVPAFLRDALPVVCGEGWVVCELLSGQLAKSQNGFQAFSYHLEYIF